MKRIRLFLATIALLVTLGGLSLTGMGAGRLTQPLHMPVLFML